MVQVDVLKAELQCGRAGCSCHHGVNRHCPAHEDVHPSLTVHQDANGRILVNCKTGCSQKQVIEALKGRGLWAVHEPDSPRTPRDNGRVAIEEKPVAIYEYKDAAGTVIAIKGRFEYPEGRKSFKWRMPQSRSWDGLKGLSMAQIPLWGVELLAGHSESIVLVEGEKSALACRAHGLLALTHGGGASTTDFGDSLLTLKGRNVILWPDNDGPGRTFMARIHALLRPIARRVSIVTPPLPEKGDAYDYFEAGGTIDDLLREVPPAEAVVDYLGHDAIGIRMPSTLGTITTLFTNMEKSSRELACEVEICYGDCGEPYSQRLNMLSGSQITEMRRNLDTIFGKEAGWAQLLNTAIAKARKAFLEQDRASRLIDIPDAGPAQFLIPDLLPEGVATVWFGNGSSLKTYMALRAAISVAGGYDFIGKPVRKGAAMLVDYENPPETFKFRCSRLFIGMGLAIEPDLPLFHWPARGIPLADQIEAIRAKVSREGITMIVIDSGAAACGGKPEDADIALGYFMALQKLGTGVTTLTVAHCAKGSDEMMPFGSVFWHNQPRRTVNFQRTDDEDADEIDIGVFYRKTNDGKKPKPISFRVTFEDEMGPVIISSGRIEDIPELDAKRNLKQRVYDALKRPMNPSDILSLLGEAVTTASINRLGSTLRNNPKMFAKESEGGGRGNEARWSRVQKV